MRRLSAALACVFAGVVAPTAHAIDYGVTEDEVKSSAARLYPALRELGMTRNVISITWDPGSPTALPPEAMQIDALLPLARANGVKVSFAVYLRRATGLTSSPAATAQFATWLRAVAHRFPEVKEYIGPNEPNLPRFWQPQFAANCANASGGAYFGAMAAMYDALKAADASIRVIGVALSPRGNDNCRARSNVSTSPVRFLKALGDAYRASGRRTPLMDGLSFHPYPPREIDPPTRGYAWPNAGMPNLDRIKQAFWDAFGGTAQPTVEDGLRLYLDEVGWQVDTGSAAGYWGSENVVAIDEPTQARFYSELIRLAACDPSIAALNLFHLVDEPDRVGLQTGLLRFGGARRPAFGTVKAAIAQGGCRGRQVVWRHTSLVIGAKVTFGVVAARGGGSSWGFGVDAAEGVEYTAAVFRLSGTLGEQATIERALASGGSAAGVTSMRGRMRRPGSVSVAMPQVALAPGRYVYAILLAAETNASRTSFATSPPLVVR